MVVDHKIQGVRPIEVVAKDLDIDMDSIITYGKDKAKLSLDLLNRNRSGKLILMTAMSPTPSGEGKTTMNIGLSMALNRLGYRAISALREPSLGPVFGLKGGATGGGKATVEPSVDINLHFTGDIHAITACNNLLSAMIDNHIFQENTLNIDPYQILWKRALDMNDRALRKLTLKTTTTSFDITAASEIMAILCLAEDQKDLERRLERIVIALDYDGNQVLAKDLGAVGAMMVLLKDALLPNLVQTSEGTPVIVHGGPFANIAHGCNSVIATKMALKLSDYVVTEAGFGADLGAQKFFDIKAVQSGLHADAVVVVATLKAMKYHGDSRIKDLSLSNPDALIKGFENLKQHVENMQKYQPNVMVALNRFPDDQDEEIKIVFDQLEALGVPAFEADVFGQGSQGGVALAKHLVESLKASTPSVSMKPQATLEESIETIAREIYRADGIEFAGAAKVSLQRLKDLGYDSYPVCIAKTQYSFSDNPKLLNVAQGFKLHITDLKVSNGAGFVVVLCGNVMTMPGMPSRPNAMDIKLDELGYVKL